MARSTGNSLFAVLLLLQAGACTREGPSDTGPRSAVTALEATPLEEAKPEPVPSYDALAAAPEKEQDGIGRARPADMSRDRDDEKSVAAPPPPSTPSPGKGLSGVGVGGGGLARAKKAESASRRSGAVPSAASAPMPVATQGALGYMAPAQQPQEMNTEAYAHIAEAGFSLVKDAPLSTFSADVDTASYSNVRRFLTSGQLPPAEAVRVEELVNYFHYAYPAPSEGEPFTTYAELGACPWNPKTKLVHIGIKAREITEAAVPPRNLVFLLDVSGSMMDQNKLPLLKRGLGMLTERLRPQDHVAIVVYAGSSGLVLPPTSGDHRADILAALERLEAGGSTNGAEGIELAYRVAESQFNKEGINRVILATDGDFNVGVTSEGALVKLIEQKRKTGVFLTVLGFGSGNLQDARMEQLADKGNGNYAYIDDVAEAQKVLVREAGSTLVTVAKDVKLQVEWNPALVESYRLVGYENRALAARDFNDDSKDAGEVGAGHTVTALYEVVMRAGKEPAAEVDALRYQSARAPVAAASDELMTVKVRYKAPNGEVSKLIAKSLHAADATLSRASSTFRFSAAVAGFGMMLRHSPYARDFNLAGVRELAGSAMDRDEHGDKAQFIELVKAAERLGLGG